MSRNPKKSSETFCAIPKIPEGLAAITEDLTREILRNRPDDIYAFAARHFEKLLGVRAEHANAPKAPTKPKPQQAPKKRDHHFLPQSGWSLNETAKVLEHHRKASTSAKKEESTDSSTSTDSPHPKSRPRKSSRSSKKSQTFYSDTIQDFEEERRKSSKEFSKKTSTRKSSERTKKTEIGEESEELFDSSGRRSSRASSSESRVRTVITRTSLEELQSPAYIEKVYRATNETTLVMTKNLETLKNQKLRRSFEERRESRKENFSSRSEKCKKSHEEEEEKKKSSDAFESKLKETQCLMEQISLGLNKSTNKSTSAKDLFRRRASEDQTSFPSVRPSSSSSSRNLVKNLVSDDLVLPEISPKSARSVKSNDEFVLPILSPPGSSGKMEKDHCNLSEKLREIETVERTIESLLNAESATKRSSTEDWKEKQKRPESYTTPLVIGLHTDTQSYVLSEGSPCEIPDSVVTVIIPHKEPKFKNALGELVSLEDGVDSAFGEVVELKMEQDPSFLRQDLEGIKEEEGEEEDEKVFEIVTSSLEEILKKASAAREKSFEVIEEVGEHEKSDDSVRFADASSKSDDREHQDFSSLGDKTTESVSPDITTPIVPELNLQDLDFTECSDKTLSYSSEKKGEEVENSENGKSRSLGATESEAKDSNTLFGETERSQEDSKLNEIICKELMNTDFEQETEIQSQTDHSTKEELTQSNEVVLEGTEIETESETNVSNTDSTKVYSHIDSKIDSEQVSSLNITDLFAVTKVQAGIRGYLTRKNFRKAKDSNVAKNEASTQDNGTFIAIAPRASPPTFEKLVQAALTIQHNYRKYVKRKVEKKTSKSSFLKIDKIGQAALTIQKSFRRYKSRKTKKLPETGQEKIMEASSQQSGVSILEMEKMMRSAIIIQRNYRRYKKRKLESANLAAKSSEMNAVEVQKSSSTLETLSTASMMIQRNYRKYKKRKEGEKVAMQSHEKSVKSSSPRLDKLIRASLIIQKSYRRYKNAKSKHQNVQEKKDLEKVDDSKKNESLRVSSPKLEKLIQASLIIQKNYRRYKNRRVKCETVTEKEKASKTQNFLQHTGEFHDTIVLPIVNTDIQIFLSSFNKSSEKSEKVQDSPPKSHEMSETSSTKIYLNEPTFNTKFSQVLILPSTTSKINYSENFSRHFYPKNKQVSSFLNVVMCDESSLQDQYLNFISSIEDLTKSTNDKSKKSPASEESAKEPLAVHSDSPRGIIIEEIKSLDETKFN